MKSERGFGWASTNPGLRIRVLAKRPERRIKSIKRVLAEQQQAAEQGEHAKPHVSETGCYLHAELGVTEEKHGEQQ